MTVPPLLLVAPHVAALRPLRDVLQTEDYNLTAAASSDEALDHLAKGTFGAVIVCHHPPDLNGLALLRRVQQCKPHAARLLWTDAPVRGALQQALDNNRVQWLLRPDAHAAIHHSTIRHAVTHAHMSQQSADEGSESDDGPTLIDLLTDRDAKLPGTFAVLMRLMHIHSSSLHRHAHRVAHLARRMASQLQLPPSVVNQVEAAAMLHDMGKVLIDPSTIRKPASLLTPEEQSPMRKHPEWGEQILSVLPSLEEAAEYVRHHHEHFDGSGYPDQLPGCQIPLGSRIISIANAYDNIHNGRSVFRTHTPKSALASIREDAPEKYDPALIDVLALEVLDEPPSDIPPTVGIPIERLEPGMRLGQDFALNPDLLLLARGAQLRTGHIIRIQQISKATPSLKYVLVYNTKEAPAPVPPSAEDVSSSEDTA